MARRSSEWPAYECRPARPTQSFQDPGALKEAGASGAWTNNAHRCANAINHSVVLMTSLRWRYLDDRGIPRGPISEDALVALIRDRNRRDSAFIRPSNPLTKHFISTDVIHRLSERLAGAHEAPADSMPKLSETRSGPRPYVPDRALTLARWMRGVRSVLIVIGAFSVADQLSPLLGVEVSATLALVGLIAIYALTYGEDEVRARAIVRERPHILAG